MVEAQHKVRWWRIVLITLVGVGVLAAPFYLAHRDSTYGTVPSIWSGTLTNIGTSIVLVGVVFFLERGLVKRVTSAAAQSTVRAFEERTAEFKTADEELATQLDDLRAEFHRLAKSEGEERTAPLRNVRTDVSFDSVAEALETANDYGALRGGVVTVPLKAPVDQPELVTFDWRLHGLPGPGRMVTSDLAPAIALSYHARRNPGGGPGIPVVEVHWMPHETPAEILMKLRTEMIRLGFGAEAKLVDTDVLEHLGCALSDAVAGRTDEDGAWVQGQLSEWLADGWAVTDKGLISRDHGTIPSSDFPKNRGIPLPPTSPPPAFEPPVPAGVSETFWKFAVDRAAAEHGRGPAARFHVSGRTPRPFTTATSPRKRAD